MADTLLQACIINCTLKASPTPSSTDKLAAELGSALAAHQVNSRQLRVADYQVAAGVETNMGTGDDWPTFRQAIYAADIVILATPIWMGHPSSFAQRVLERLDAELSERDDKGRLRTYGKVAGVIVVGNEDGAHHVSAELYQGLNDVGFSLPANAVTYWNGEAMQTTDYRDLPKTPAAVARTTKTMAANLAHLGRLLRATAYPPA